MKYLGKLWWVIEIFMVGITFFNPYIGYMGVFQAFELFFLSILTLNIRVREKVNKKNNYNEYVKSTLKGLKNVGYIVSVAFFLVNIFVDCTMFKVTHEQNRFCAPCEIFVGNFSMGIILLAMALILSALSSVAYIARMKNIEV